MSGLGLILSLLAIGSALAFGAAAAALARVTDFAAFVVATLVGGAAQVVFIAQVLSPPGLWKTGPVLVLQLVSAAAILLLAHRAGADWSVPRRAFSELKASYRRASLRGAARHPLVVSAAALAILMLIAQLTLAIAVAPNTWDSMTYHLTRAVYWLQEASIMQFDGATERQAAFPVNAEVLQGWTMMMSEGDRLVQLVQWTAQLGVIAFVFAAARDLRFGRVPAMFAAIVLISMPAFAAQATSSQNDLTVTFFACAAMLFLMRSVAPSSVASSTLPVSRRGTLVLAAAAFGLMVGTKTNGVLIGAAIGAAVLVVAGRDWRRLVAPAVACIAGVILMAGLNYGQNIVDRGGPFAVEAADQHKVASPREWPINTTHIAWTTAMNFPGVSLGSLQTIAERLNRSLVERPAAKLSGVPPQNLGVSNESLEDRVGLGLPLLLFLLPALVIALSRPRERDRFAYALAAVLGFALVCATLRHNPWIGRFQMSSAAIAAPLIAGLMTREAMRMLAVVAVALSLLPQSLQSAQKTLMPATGGGVLRLDRTDQITYLSFKKVEAPFIRAVEKSLPEGSRLGYVGIEDSWEYPYAGAHRERTLVKVPAGRLDARVFERYDLDGLLIADPKVKAPAEFRTEIADSQRVLILRPGGP